MSASADDAGGLRTPRAAVHVVATLAVLGALYLGRVFLVPVSLALVLTALLAPVVGWMARRHVPAPAGAAVGVLASVALLVGAGAALAPPLRGLADEIPSSIAAARTRLARFEEPLARIGLGLQSQRPRGAGSSHRPAAAPAGARSDSAAAPRPDSAAAPRPDSAPSPAAGRGGDGGDGASSAVSRRATGATHGGGPSDAPSSSSSGVAPSGVLAAVERTFGVTAELVGELVEVLLLTFFLLAGGRTWGEKLARAVPDDRARRTTLTAVVETRIAVARYILVTALINLGQGAVVALATWGIGLPSPLLWGALTFVLEFVPYLGGFVMVALLLLAGLAGGGGLLHALLAPLAYLAITTLQNNLVSPAAYGRGLRLNPTAVLLAVMFWYAMWGVAGAFLAVPLLAAARILASHVPALAPVGAFLEE